MQPGHATESVFLIFCAWLTQTEVEDTNLISFKIVYSHFKVLKEGQSLDYVGKKKIVKVEGMFCGSYNSC